MHLQQLNMRFPSKRAFITGAGSGLGAAFTQLLLDQGWTLFLSDIHAASLERYQGQPNVHIYVLDVSEKSAYARIVEEIAQDYRHIDVLINNAGIGDGAFFQDYQLEHWERMVQVNLMGTVYGTKLLLPLLQAAEGALVINIGSMAGVMNAPAMSAYNVTKAAIHSFSETLLHELRPLGIQVSVVAPTFFKTNIMSQAHGSDALVQFAEQQMAQSLTNAGEMAMVILSRAARGQFFILHPRTARQRYFMKRWFPGLVRKRLGRLAAAFR